MKQKYIISLLIVSLGFVGLTSCELEETPYGFYSEDNFYKT